MPFSSGSSVRAPASKATSSVVARVPTSSTRWTGRPLAAVDEVMRGMRRTIAAREIRLAESQETQAFRSVPSKLAAPMDPNVIEFHKVTKSYDARGETGLRDVASSVARDEFLFL